MRFRVADPDRRYVAVRLSSDLPLDGRFRRDGDDWVLELDPPGIARLEYQLEVEHADGDDRVACSTRATRSARPGAFGEKSVLELPGYEPPAWLEAEASRALRRRCRSAGAGSALGGRACWCAGGRRPRRRRCRCCSPTTGRSTTRSPALTRYCAAR